MFKKNCYFCTSFDLTMVKTKSILKIHAQTCYSIKDLRLELLNLFFELFAAVGNIQGQILSPVVPHNTNMMKVIQVRGTGSISFFFKQRPVDFNKSNKNNFRQSPDSYIFRQSSIGHHPKLVTIGEVGTQIDL